MNSLKPPRNAFLDYLKGSLILLVAYGHAIQFTGYRNEDYWDDPVYKAVYMFHMPLFMAVSGYVSFSSLSRRPFWEVVLLRFRQLIVPIIACAILCQTVLHCLHPHAPLNRLPREVVGEMLYSLWFLWALFGATLAAAVLHHFGRDTIFYASLATVLLLCAPEPWNVHLFKYTLPFFWAGYFTARRARDVGQPFPAWATGNACLAAMILASAVCYLLWSRDTYVYLVGMTVHWDHLQQIPMRWVAGGVSSGAALSLFWRLYRIWRPQFLVTLGAGSLAIYILQGFIFTTLEKLDHPWRNTLLYTLFIAPFVSALIIFVCFALGRRLSEMPFVGQAFFGRAEKVSVSKT